MDNDDQKLNQWSAAYLGNYQWFTEHNIQSTIDKKDNSGRTALYSAAKKGHLSIVMHLVVHHANVNCIGPNGSTPLHAAAFCGKGTVVQFLVGYGCSRNIKNSLGLTASEEAKNNQIKQMILHPTRGNTERFTVKKRDLPAFFNDGNNLVMNVLEYALPGDISRVNLIKEMKKNHKFYASELQNIINADKNTWNKKLVYLYTLESPLYKRMNADLAALNQLSHYKLYANCLGKALNTLNLPRWNKICYRSVYLNSDQIKSFQKCKNFFAKLPAFSSCTKSKQIALGWGGNALMVVYPPGTKSSGYSDYAGTRDCAIDITSIGAFGDDEQEVLLSWSTQLYILGVKVVYHNNSNVKYEIEVLITSVGG